MSNRLLPPAAHIARWKTRHVESTAVTLQRLREAQQAVALLLVDWIRPSQIGDDPGIEPAARESVLLIAARGHTRVHNLYQTLAEAIRDAEGVQSAVISIPAQWDMADHDAWMRHEREAGRIVEEVGDAPF